MENEFVTIIGDNKFRLGDIKSVRAAEGYNSQYGGPSYVCYYLFVNESQFSFGSDRESRDLKLREVNELLKKYNERFTVKSVLKEHRDAFITILFVLVIDHFIFGGRLKEGAEKFINSFLDIRHKEITD